MSISPRFSCFQRAARPALTIGLCVAAFGTGAAPALAGFDNPDGSRVDTFDSQSMLLPTSTVRGGTAVKLTAAKNEYESFQVMVRASQQPIGDLSVSLGSALTGPGGTIPADAVRFHREAYYRLTTMSDGELRSEFPRDAAGTCQGDCRIPDALIPAKDALTNETRAAFPVTVPATENRVAWVDVRVPADAKAGTYSGTVVVRSGAKLLSTVPVSLDVLNTGLPSTATMKSQVFVNANDIGNSWATYQQLAQLGLSNRLSVVPDGLNPQTGAGVLGPLLSGTDPKVSLAGARLTQLPLNRHADLVKWRQVLAGLGKADAARFWCDEVSTASCSSWFSTALASYPGLKLQQIPQYRKATSDPDYLETRAHTAVPNAIEQDEKTAWLQRWKAAAAGREIWTYTSCMQGGCTAPYLDHALYNGTPGFGIDQPASQARATGWHGFRVGLDGEHYWTAAGAYARSWASCTGMQPKNCQYTAAGEATGMNGDGNLFYAYDKAIVGGTTPVPVETIRLKRFRDGREDNDLMQLLAAKGKRPEALAIATGLFPSFTQSTKTAADVAAAREKLVALAREAFPAAPAPPRAAQDLNCDGNADMLAVSSDGRLLLYARRQGDWDPSAPTLVATGWRNKYRQLLLPGDIDGDSKPDLLGRTANNTFDVYRGNCAGGFTAGGSLDPSFKLEDPSTPGDFDGDSRADLIDRKPDGTLWLASGTGAGAFNAPRRIGAGWTGFTLVGAGDADRDGRTDVFGRRSDGRVFLYRGNGAGGWITGNGEDSGLVLSPVDVPQLLGPGDMNADAKVDMVVVDAAGKLLQYAGSGTGSWSMTPTQIGAGWNTAVVQVAD